MKISTILEKIDENQLFVPAFQREYVWKREDAKQLVDSLIKEYPTKIVIIDSRNNLTNFKNITIATPNEPEIKRIFPGRQFFSDKDFFEAGNDLLA